MERDVITRWKDSFVVGKSSSVAKVANSPLVQEVVRTALSSGYKFPAEFVRASGLRHDTLHLFITGRVIPTPETLLKILEYLPEESHNSIWDYYGCEIRKGKGNFTGHVRGTEVAHRAAINAHKTRRMQRQQSA